MRHILLLAFVVTCTVAVWAQNQVFVDQLVSQVQQMNDTRREVLLLRHIRQLYEAQQPADLAYYLKRIDRAVEVMPSIKPYLKEGKGLLCMLYGDYGSAQTLIDEAIEAFKQAGDRVGVARCQQYHAHIGLRDNNPARAVEWLDRAGKVIYAADNKELVAEHYALLGASYQVQDLTTKALDNYRSALREYDALGHAHKIFEIAEQCARICLKADYLEDALQYAEMMTQSATLDTGSPDIGLGYLLMAQAQTKLGQTGLAIEAALAGLQLADNQTTRVTRALLHAEIARLQYIMRQAGAAQDHIRSALVLLEAAPDNRQAAEAAEVVARLAGDNRDNAQAMVLLQLANKKHRALNEQLQAKAESALSAQSAFLASIKSERYAEEAQRSVRNAREASYVAFLMVILLCILAGLIYKKYLGNKRRFESIEQELHLTVALCREQEEIILAKMEHSNQEMKQLNLKLSHGQMLREENEKIIAEQKNIIHDLQSRLESISNEAASRHTTIERLSAQLQLAQSAATSYDAHNDNRQTLAIVERLKEMREPLHHILTQADYLTQQNNNQQLSRHAYDNVRFAARDILALVNEVFQASEVETEKLTLHKQPFDPVKSLSWLYHRFADGMPDHQAIRFELDDIISVPVLGDGDALVRACALALAYVRNSNPQAAIQFIGSGFGTDTEYELQLQIVIKAGQLPCQLPKADDPMVRRMHTLIDMQHGHHHIEHRTDGFIWVLRIPYPVVEKVQTHVSPTELLGVKVLLVEDNPINQALTSKLLKQHGIEVETANHGAEALEKLTERNYDLILMDLMMPVMDGYVTTRQIRQSDLEYLRNIPIIALTASAYVDETEKARMFGMNDYLGKPFSPDELLYVMARCWRQHLRMFGQAVRVSSLQNNFSDDRPVSE